MRQLNILFGSDIKIMLFKTWEHKSTQLEDIPIFLFYVNPPFSNNSAIVKEYSKFQIALRYRTAWIRIKTHISGRIYIDIRLKRIRIRKLYRWLFVGLNE